MSAFDDAVARQHAAQLAYDHALGEAPNLRDFWPDRDAYEAAALAWQERLVELHQAIESAARDRMAAWRTGREVES